MKINFDFLLRKKKYDETKLEHTNLSRVLSLIDLSALGISCTLGSGIYVLAGTVISKYAGPSIVLSFLIAGLASFLAGLSYAELGARVPRSGSAYIYIYVTIGEFVAFIIGWDVILEYIIGTSSTASALSQYIDSMFNNTISTALHAAFPMNIHGLAPYPDFLAFGLTILVTILLIIGVRESSFLNIIFTGLNMAVILFIIIGGSLKTNINYWNISLNKNLSWIDVNGVNQTCASAGTCGQGGFMPFGFDGIISGAAKCFYAFIGFDAIATTGEEVKNPKKTIPLSIVITLIVVASCYMLSSAVLTLMIPYYMLDPDIPLTQAFNYVNMHWASTVVAIGAIASLATCLYASMFPMPRVVYSMASDRLIFKNLAWIMPKLKTPAAAASTTGLFAAVLVLMFDLNQLIDMMSIGTLLAYSLVSACTLVLRYRPYDETNREHDAIEHAHDHESYDSIPPKSEATILNINTVLFGRSNEPLLKRMFRPSETECTTHTAHLVSTITILAIIDIVILCILLNKMADLSETLSICLLVFFSVILIVLTFVIWMQPQNQHIDTFKTPFVPITPLLSAFINIYLMTTLEPLTWIRFGAWFIIGVFMYLGYAIRNSVERVYKVNQFWLLPCIELDQISNPKSF